jgi:hypothetical protein
MKAFLTSGRMQLPADLGPRGETPDFVDVGMETVVVKRRWGQGGLGLEWSLVPFGLKSRASGRVMSHTVLDRVSQLHDYEGLATRLCAVPVYGYRWRSGEEWMKVVPGWTLGFFDDGDDAGFLLAADEVDHARRPVVADWPATRTWLLSEKWQQMKLLRQAAETDRDAIGSLERPAG